MYTMTCDGHPLLDVQDDAYIIGSPRVKNEVNTVGEGSFKIYFNHPNIDKLKPLLSVFEVKDEFGVIFRGRMTEDTKDFDNCKDVDLEGAMSYFNDSVVRPYVFPDDFLDDAEYKAAAAETAEQAALDGGVVRFLLKWYIDRHNEQVEPFQQFKLGNVTVYDKNNYIERATSDYTSTWKEVSGKLFNSSLGGFICIRYEADGNYIDYLREFTEVNEQGITYGENMLDISQNTNANETYSAIIPLGKEAESTESSGEVHEGLYVDIVDSSTVKRKLTIESLPDGNITSDIVKKGDALYSKAAVSKYGWRCAPIDETTWDDVEEPENLQSKGVEFLEGDSTNIPNTIKVTAVDLNCTDSQIRSFRIYKKIPVYTLPHAVNDNFDLTALDVDLLNPQNTKITVGKTVMTITKHQAKQESSIESVKSALNSYAPNTQVAEGFKKTEKLVEETETSIKNGFASIYATKEELAETAASLEITDEHIEAVVSGKYATFDELGNYATTEEVESKISVALDGIDLSVYAKTSDLEGLVTTEEVESKISVALDGIDLSTYKAFTDLEGNVQSAEARLNLAVFTDEEGNLQSSIHIGANLLTIETDNFTLDIDGNVSLTGDIMAKSLTILEGATITGDITASGLEVNYENRYSGDVHHSFTAMGGFKSTWKSSFDYNQGDLTGGYFTTKCKPSSTGSVTAEGKICTSGTQFVVQVKEGTGYLQGTWESSSSISTNSDQTLKHDIEALDDKYSRLFDCLQAVRYKYNDGTSDRFHTGFIAQSVEQAIEQAGLSSQDFAAFVRAGDKCSLRYEEFIALCVDQIQKLKERITELEERNISA